ncbi:CKLF-like MARVEL transmembrane domain-containing protein 8 [Centruroides vittatus]|uniref:CKLF-like MARVEL transmembrane domain-containing protein 8 n=1 Tax=Centruroides vittatus TaxID=120091 RepID=UPI003510D225
MAGETTVQTTQKTETRTNAGISVTTKTESTGILDGLHLNPWYFKTIPGILKLVQLVIGIICMGCGSPVKINYAHFFMFVVVICFLITFLLCFAFLISLKDITQKLPWMEGELIYTGIATILYFIAAVVQLAMTVEQDNKYFLNPLKYIGVYDAYIAAGVFALFNTIAYGVGVYFLFIDWRSSRQPN